MLYLNKKGNNYRFSYFNLNSLIAPNPTGVNDTPVTPLSKTSVSIKFFSRRYFANKGICNCCPETVCNRVARLISSSNGTISSAILVSTGATGANERCC